MENFGHEPAQDNSMSLEQFEDLVRLLYLQKQVCKKIEEELDAATKELEETKLKVSTALEQAGKSSYKSEMGTVTLVNKFSVETPKDLESKRLFFDWLRERQIFDEYATVHSAKLNALYNEHLALSQDPNFSIPGIGQPKHYKQLSIRMK